MPVYCPFCMREQKEADANNCCHCGKDFNYTGSYPQLPVGTLLDGKYLLGASLALCGTYISYIALDTVSGKRKVIKECFSDRWGYRDKNGSLRPKNGNEDEYRRNLIRFVEDARRLCTFTELKTVCSVEAYFEANNTAYMVMEYIERKEITRVIREQGLSKMSDLEPLFKPLMEDVAQMHRMGFLHNEIEPRHIYVRDDGTPILLGDYSIRKIIGELEEKAIHLFTTGYAPLEQFKRTRQGPCSDVYSMAGTICFCLTGKSPMGTIERTFNDEMKFPLELGADITEKQNNALKKAMELKAEKRTQTMEEFIEDLFGQEKEEKTKELPKHNRFRELLKAVKKKNGA